MSVGKGWNLPPGVSTSDLPGWSRTETERDELEDYYDDMDDEEKFQMIDASFSSHVDHILNEGGDYEDVFTWFESQVSDERYFEVIEGWRR